MFANVVRMKFKPDACGDATLLWKESVLPELKAQMGWRDAAFIAQSHNDAMIFTLRDTETQARGFGLTMAYRKEFARLERLATGPMSQTVYALGTAEEQICSSFKLPIMYTN